jgi:hypothetical protein
MRKTNHVAADHHQIEWLRKHMAAVKSEPPGTRI